jgi:hypothetical protein
MATKESDWFEIFDEIILLQKYWMELNEILIKSSLPKLYLLTPSNFQQGYYIVIHVRWFYLLIILFIPDGT